MTTTDTIVRVDPKTLLVGPNVRKEIDLPAEFVASVKEHGVKIPIVAHETQEGLEVVDGQMRTLAALDAGLTEVPVYVRSAVTDGERVVEQLVVNRERTALSRRDTVAAVKQLALDFKMPAAAVAKKVGLKAAEVKSVLAIAGNENATALLESPHIALDVAAKIADAGLSKEQVKQIAQNPHNAEHQLQRILDERAEKALIADLEKQVKESGVPLVARPTPPYSSEAKNKHKYLSGLVDKATGEKLTAASHASCEGHAAYVGKPGGYDYSSKIEIRYLCTEPAKFGHREANRQAPKVLSDAEKAERKVAAERGKVWPSIVTVRTTWIREQLLTRKTMPPAWEQFVARVTTGIFSSAGDVWSWGDTARELLQIEKSGYSWSPFSDYLEKNPARADAVLVAIAIARVERLVGDKAGWKNLDAGYLQLLEQWGYKLSDLEQEIVAAAAKKGKRAA